MKCVTKPLPKTLSSRKCDLRAMFENDHSNQSFTLVSVSPAGANRTKRLAPGRKRALQPHPAFRVDSDTHGNLKFRLKPENYPRGQPPVDRYETSKTSRRVQPEGAQRFRSPRLAISDRQRRCFPRMNCCLTFYA